MDRIGRYEILAELGRGAMGVVYRARDPKIGRHVAIKTIKLADQADPGQIEALRERLFREAQSAGQLSHPGIVTVYDVDEEDGVAYIAMEFVEGRTLESILREAGAQNLEFAVDVLRQAAAALDYAHGRGIVHRDIKPANLMLTSDGALKIMDFGIARVASSQLTQTATVMGTPSYMSPEQVRGEPIDGRSDQFSLGVIAYEMLTGKKPFRGDNLTAVIFNIVSAEPERTFEAASWVTPELDEAVSRALAKKRDGRHESCREFAERFAAAAAGLAGPATARPAVHEGDEPDSVEATAMEQQFEASGAFDETVIETPDTAAASDTGATEPAAGKKLLPLAARKASKSAAPSDEPDEPVRRPWKVAVAVVTALAFLAVGGLFLIDPEDPLAAAEFLALELGGVGNETGQVPEPLPQTPPAPIVEAETEEEAPPDSEPAPSEAAAAKTETARTQPPPEPKRAETKQEQTAPPEPARTEASSAAKPPEDPPQPAPRKTETASAPRPASTAPPAAAPKAAAKTSAPATGAVYFRTNRLGATVTVGGRADWSCRTPCRIDDLPAGRHTVVASMDGFRTATRSFEIAGGAEQIVEIDLDDARIQVILTSEPEGGDIFIDGRMVPQKTNTKIPLPEGTYQIRVVKEGVGEAEQVVLVDRQRLPFAKFILKKKED